MATNSRVSSSLGLDLFVLLVCFRVIAQNSLDIKMFLFAAMLALQSVSITITK